jgi:hypothetical protein
MAAVLFLLVMMANPVTTTTVMPNSSNATSTNQSSIGETIKAAQIRHNRIFGAYVLILVLTVLGTYLVWSSGNKVQDAIQADANARIAASTALSDQANQSAREANALAEAARADAETARTEQEKIKNDSLRLELRLRSAEESQAQLQQKNTEATTQIQKLEEAAKPRTISLSQQTKVVELLKNFSGQEVEVRRYAQENEAANFAGQVVQTLDKAGLKIQNNIMMDGTGTGFGVAVHDEKSAPILATTILLAFRSAGFDIGGIVDPKMAQEGKFFIFIGAKPIAK